MRLCKATEKIIRKKEWNAFTSPDHILFVSTKQSKFSKLTTELTTLCAKLFTFEIFEIRKVGSRKKVSRELCSLCICSSICA